MTEANVGTELASQPRSGQDAGRDGDWDAVLTDGGLVHLRRLRRDDAEALHELTRGLSDRSLYLRFFTASTHAADSYVDQLVLGTDTDRMALVAEHRGELIGLASYDRLPGTADAEVAFLVADRHQHRGVGTLLLEHLAALARAGGIRRFVAETLPDNAVMLQVFGDAGFAVSRTSEQGAVHVAFPIAVTEHAQEAVDSRERAADVRSLRRVLAPRSVAVVGASDRPDAVGYALLRNILDGGFTGAVYPVNRNAGTVGGLRAYRTVADLPEPVDLAVVAVPAASVPDVLEDCGRRGVSAAVLITAGFGETGGGGAGRERAIIRQARRLGIRLVGPNCLGVANTDPAVRLNATFARDEPQPGPLGFASQSGALGIALLRETARRGLGVSGFVSLGNKADVSGNDLLLYWEDDPRTAVIALYLESFGNPRKFARHASRIGRHTPIVALKAGRTAAGSRAGLSHTAAAATPDAVVTALLDASGVIRVNTTAELLDVAHLLGDQPLPVGSRLGVIGNSGGPGILAADAAEVAGLQVPELSPGLQRALAEAVPRIAGTANPVDLGAAAGQAEFEPALRLLLTGGEVDAVVVIYAVVLVSEPERVAAAIRRAAGETAIPVAAAILGTDVGTDLGTGVGSALREPNDELRPVPAFDFPEAAVNALGQAAWHARWRQRPTGSRPHLGGVDIDAARTLVVQALAARPGGGWLDPVSAVRLVSAFGVLASPTVLATSAEQAVAEAARLGYPVALKTAGEVVHKSDVGGIRLNLSGPEAVRTGYAEVAAAGGRAEGGVVVQAMAGSGVELLVGVTRVDPFPPLVLFGLGGVTTHLLADHALRLAPLTDVDARELVRGLRASPLLFGYRGAPEVDIAGLEDLLLRVGLLADEIPELAELDLNPVLAAPSGVVAVDVKVRLAPPTDLTDPLLRRLR